MLQKKKAIESKWWEIKLIIHRMTLSHLFTLEGYTYWRRKSYCTICLVFSRYQFLLYFVFYWRGLYIILCFTFTYQSQALVSNPKIEVRDGTYGFKPKYNLKDKKALLRLLDKHDQLGLGGVLLEDVEEGLPNSAKAIKVLNIIQFLVKHH